MKIIYIIFFVASIVLITNLEGNDNPKVRPSKESIENTDKLQLGIDLLIESDFQPINGKKIGLLTNNSGRTSEGILSAEAISKSKKCTLTTLFSPEHGFWTAVPAGDYVADEKLFDIPVISLYGKQRRPTREMLSECEIILIDIQDIGVRSYTYLSTIYNMLDAAAEYGIPVFILDRPNPLGGSVVDGNVVEKGKDSFVGIAPVAYVHGCTIGELAKMIVGEGWLHKDSKGKPRKCELTVIKMKNWNRKKVWEDTGLMWIPTSPHIPSPDACRGYATIGFLGELGIIGIGIGTTSPFQYIGMPDFKIAEFADKLSSYDFNGIKLIASKFRPLYGANSGKDCLGFYLKFAQKQGFAPFSAGIKIMLALRSVYPSLFTSMTMESKTKKMFEKVTGTDDLIEAFLNGSADEKILKLAVAGLDNYINIRQKYLLY
ncbi:MAG: hypothetical protein HW421_1385 [Ignavibacteria bacterium]|nr:hypothetical protein [Ignavibacteria bacterium]